MMADDEDRFRWCVHCRADCWVDPEDQQHAADCPFSTGLWPVETDAALEVARWVRWESDAPADVKAQADEALAREPVCDECHAPFRSGDVYMLRSMDSGEVENRPVAGMMIWIGCAAGVAP